MNHSMYTYIGYKAAFEAAAKESMRYPDTPIYIQWIEDNEWILGESPDEEDDAYYMNGIWTYPPIDEIE